MQLGRFFSRFKRGRQRQRGVRRGDRQARDARSETEFVSVPPLPNLGGAASPSPDAPQPAAPQPGAAPLSAPQPAPPQPGPPQPSAPAPVPPPPPATPAADAGSTRLISVPGASQAGVVGVLIAVDGKIRDEIYKVRDGENRMGRLPSGEIIFDDRDDSISREHALIIHQHGSFGIKPLRESNPTFVNGEQIEGGASLGDGDTIQMGNTTFKFRVV